MNVEILLKGLVFLQLLLRGPSLKTLLRNWSRVFIYELIRLKLMTID